MTDKIMSAREIVDSILPNIECKCSGSLIEPCVECSCGSQERYETKLALAEALTAQAKLYEAQISFLEDKIKFWIPSMKSMVRLLEKEGYNNKTIIPKEKMIAEFDQALANLAEFRKKVGE